MLQSPGTFVDLKSMSLAGRTAASALVPGPCVVYPQKRSGDGPIFAQAAGQSAEALVVAAMRLDRPGQSQGMVINFTNARGREHAPKAAAQALHAQMFGEKRP